MTDPRTTPTSGVYYARLVESPVETSAIDRRHDFVPAPRRIIVMRPTTHTENIVTSAIDMRDDVLRDEVPGIVGDSCHGLLGTERDAIVQAIEQEDTRPIRRLATGTTPPAVSEEHASSTLVDAIRAGAAKRDVAAIRDALDAAMHDDAFDATTHDAAMHAATHGAATHDAAMHGAATHGAAMHDAAMYDAAMHDAAMHGADDLDAIDSADDLIADDALTMTLARGSSPSLDGAVASARGSSMSLDREAAAARDASMSLDRDAAVARDASMSLDREAASNTREMGSDPISAQHAQQMGTVPISMARAWSSDAADATARMTMSRDPDGGRSR